MSILRQMPSFCVPGQNICSMKKARKSIEFLQSRQRRHSDSVNVFQRQSTVLFHGPPSIPWHALAAKLAARPGESSLLLQWQQGPNTSRHTSECAGYSARCELRQA